MRRTVSRYGSPSMGVALVLFGLGMTFLLQGLAEPSRTPSASPLELRRKIKELIAAEDTKRQAADAPELDALAAERINTLQSTEELERGFLINEFKLTVAELEEVRVQRSQLSFHLQKAAAWAALLGVRESEVTDSLLNSYFDWMENRIGEGGIARLKEITGVKLDIQ